MGSESSPRAAVRPSAVKIEVTASRVLPLAHNKRRWRVTISRSVFSSGGPPRGKHDETKAELRDPFTVADYTNYEKWCRRAHQAAEDASDVGLEALSREVASTAMRLPPAREDSIGTVSTAAGTRPVPSIDDYRDELRRFLGLSRHARARHVKIYICEGMAADGQVDADHSSIHSLLWELLEHETSEQTVEVHRLFTGLRNLTALSRGLSDPVGQLRILLVVARSLQQHEVRSGYLDTESVVYDALSRLTRYLKGCGHRDRLHVDVVSVGGFDDFSSQLRTGGSYDIVHFDMHGVVEDATGEPQLMFAHPEGYNAPRGSKLVFNQPELGELGVFESVSAENVAEQLRDHGVTAVALSACLSSYAQGRPLSNMCRIFASHGVRVITGMSFTVWNLTARSYYESFYRTLVLAGRSFRGAAAQGRLTLRDEETAREKVGEGRPIWPIATTYLTAGVFDRTDTAALGLGPDPTPADLAAAAAPRWMRRGGRRGWAPGWRKQEPSLAAYDAFLGRPEINGMEHSVALLALEDQLTKRGSLYIQLSPAGGEEKHRVRCLGDLWLATNFFDKVEIVSASCFLWPFWLWFQLLRAWLAFCWAGRRAAADLERTSRTVLIVDEVDDVIKRGKARGRGVLERIDDYIQHLQAERTSLHIIFLTTRAQQTVGWSKVRDVELKGRQCDWMMAHEYLAELAGPFAKKPCLLTLQAKE